MANTFEECLAMEEEENRCDELDTCVDAADWLDEEDEPDNPLVEGLIECGEMVAFVGQAKAGKSLLALQFAVCVAVGLPFLGKPTTRQHVYVANLEVSRNQYKKRLRRVSVALGVRNRDLRGWLSVDNLKGRSVTWEYVLAKCKRKNCAVSIVDPFYQLARIVEKDEQQCLDAVEEMKAFARAGITLCAAFHAPKGFSGDRQLIDMISGSAILARFPESIIGLLNHASDKAARVVDAVLRNYPPPDPFAVSLANGVLELALDISPEVATARNAWKRGRECAPTVDIFPYVENALDKARNETARRGVVFRGLKKGALVEKVRYLMKCDNKTPPGRDATANLIEGLPPDKITITRKTAEGVLIGKIEDMRWYAK